jgi:hypothetical protein
MSSKEPKNPDVESNKEDLENNEDKTMKKTNGRMNPILKMLLLKTYLWLMKMNKRVVGKKKQ